MQPHRHQAERIGAHKTARTVACDAGTKPAGKQRLLGTLKIPKQESKLQGLEGQKWVVFGAVFTYSVLVGSPEPFPGSEEASFFVLEGIPPQRKQAMG